MNTSLRRHCAALLGAACLLGQSTASAATIPVLDDAQVNQTAAVVSWNYGHRQWFDVVGTASNNRWSYVNFGDVRNFLPSGTVAADVSKAYLHLYVSQVGGAGSVDLFAVSGSWVEGTSTGGTQGGTLTWSSKPASTGSALNTFSVATSDEDEYIVLDVTTLVQDWITNPGNNYGLVLKPNGTSIEVYFDAKENIGGGANGGASHAPFLDVVLVPQNANLSAVAAGTWTGANSITTLGTISSGTWNGTTIALANGGTGATTASGARSNLGLTIGSNVQAWDADIDDLADGSLTGSKVGSGIDASNVTSGTLSVAIGGTGTTSGSITGTDALTFAAGGSNKGITLTPSGTGSVILSSNASVNSLSLGRGSGGDVRNSAFGFGALSSNTTGSNNTAVGHTALQPNTTGYNNTAIGAATLQDNTIGYHNTATGYFALYRNTEGDYNTALGAQALDSNTTGGSNTAVGASALESNTTGNSNVAVGMHAIQDNTTGGGNTAFGGYALASNTTGSGNVAIGNIAFGYNTTSISNTVIGSAAGVYQANGVTPLDASGYNIYIGANVRGYNNSDANSIVIGTDAIGEGANTTVIGNSSTAATHIYGDLTATAPTPANGTNNTQLATTAFVTVANAQSNSGIAPFADGTYNFYNDGTSGNVTSITIANGIVTNITTAP